MDEVNDSLNEKQKIPCVNPIYTTSVFVTNYKGKVFL